MNYEFIIIPDLLEKNLVSTVLSSRRDRLCLTNETISQRGNSIESTAS